MGKSANVVVGRRSVALTAEAVYNVAHSGVAVEPDFSFLEHATRKRSKIASPVLLPDAQLQEAEDRGDRQRRGQLQVLHTLVGDPGASDTSVFLEGQVLTVPEVRAALVVLLHKLLLGPFSIRKFLPIFLTEVLNSGLAPSLRVSALADDSAVMRALVLFIYQVKNHCEHVGDGSLLDEAELSVASENAIPGNGPSASQIGLSELKRALEKSGAGEIGVTEDEMIALECSSAASIGIAALASYSLNWLSVVSDAIVALSCEALSANTGTYGSESSEEGFVRKWEADVASDLNSLLFGSKLVKAREGADAECIDNIPAAHGALRDAVKSLGPRLRVELNRVETFSKKRSLVPGSSPSSDLVSSSGNFTSSSSLFSNTLLSLLVSLGPNISGSFDRICKGLDCLSPSVSINDWDGGSAEGIVSLRRRIQLAAAIAAAGGDENELLLSRETLSAVEKLRRLFAKECTVAFVLLSIRERLSAKGTLGQEVRQGRVTEQESGGTVASHGRAKLAAGGRAAKIKKEFVLGKGTDVVRQSLDSYLNVPLNEDFASCETLSIVEKRLDSLLNPDVPELQSLVTQVKSVLESNETRRLPKIAKGTRDFKPEQMAIREKAFGVIAAIFKRHGAVALDTPVFELRETLMGKYGEDSKLIYDLADQGGEILSLRYDLTVPFARYLAMNKVENLKRYHIARVYRRDNPAKGRYREFYQCDLDIAGQYAPMVPDFEVLKVLTELLDELNIGDYEVKLNHRRLLDGMLDICGVPQAQFRTICSAIDKLDKLPWEQVRTEMVKEKGLTPETADKIGGLVQKRGSPLALLEELKQTGSPFLQHSGSTAALEELGVLFKYLKAARCINRIVFDLSLARGLDYYTGVIYEAVFKGTTQVGSIAAGGRYDNLVGMFSGKAVPAVGVSLGIERVFAIMEKQEEERKTVLRINQTDVLVVVLGKDERWTEIAIEIVTDLWEGRLKSEFACVAPAKLPQQLGNAAKLGIPWVVIAGGDELKNGIVRLKNISLNEQEDIKREDLVEELKRRIGVLLQLPTVVQ